MIDPRLEKIIWEELDLPGYPLEEGTVATQVPGWDSLSHVRILCSVEKEFGLRFRSLDVIRLRNVGELQALILRKLEAER